MESFASSRRELAAALMAAAVPAFAAETAATCAPKSDILVRSDATLAPVRPADCGVVTQSPPDFSWPPQNGQNTYALSLTRPDGKVETRTTTRNYLFWDHPLPPGRYSWRLKASSANETSQPRTFTIAPDAVPFVLPDPDTLLQRARSAPRPRTWHDAAAVPARLKAGGAFRGMLEEVQNKMPSAVQP